MQAAASRIRVFLEDLRLCVNERKFQVHPCAGGVTFLGWRLLPGRARLARGNVVRIRRRLRGMRKKYQAGLLTFAHLNATVQAWLGHAAWGDTWRLRRQLFGSLTLVAAAHGRNAGRRLEQQSTERPRLEP